MRKHNQADKPSRSAKGNEPIDNREAHQLQLHTERGTRVQAGLAYRRRWQNNDTRDERSEIQTGERCAAAYKWF
jgi:hypothetical protein